MAEQRVIVVGDSALARVAPGAVEAASIEDAAERAARLADEGYKVLVAARGAWEAWRKAAERLREVGGNHFLLDAADFAEAELARRSLLDFVLARVAYQARVPSEKAPTREVRPRERRVARRQLLERLARGSLLAEYSDSAFKGDPCSSKPLRSHCEELAKLCGGCPAAAAQPGLELLRVPSYSREGLQEMLAALKAVGPGYLVFVCRQSAGELVERLRGLEGARFPIFTVPVGCPYAVGLEELLAARALGLKPILACSQVDEGCREAGRIYAETVARDYEKLAGERLEVLAVGEAAELLRGGDPGTRPLEGLEELWPPKLRHLAVGEAARLTRGRRGRVELATYFAGYVHVDRERCTLCGACAANCPTSALTLERGGAERLMFVNASCIACGYCAEVCPYNAIRVERAIEPSEYLLRKPRAESEMARCISCGKPVAPLRMLRGVAEELRRQGFGEEYVKAVYLCGECKTRYALGLLDLSTLRNPYEEGPAGG